MKFENINIYNFSNALRGMRNPKESYNKSDSRFGYISESDIEELLEQAMMIMFNDISLAPIQESQKLIYDTLKNSITSDVIFNMNSENKIAEYAIIGPNDMKLAKQLIAAGSEHRKFLRQIFVSVDITAPLYWWKEFDTYKVGTVANSTSTMHKIMSKPITLESFEIDDYQSNYFYLNNEFPFKPENIIEFCEKLRQSYLLEKDKNPSTAQIIWKELIRWLPNSWLQTRTVTMNYENLLGMCSRGQRRFHKLTEWSGYEKSFISFARSLPYASNFLFGDEI